MQKKPKENDFLPQIGIDLMGSDTDSCIIIDSLLPVFEKLQNEAHFVVFGKESCASLIPKSPYLSYETASESVEMEDHPLWAARKKRDSSLALGIQSLKKQQIDAFISMGNTGALVATARSQLKTLSPITHPALLACLPSKKGKIAVLDVGANVEYKSSHLVEFAAMGIAYQKAQGIQNPTVGLLNIGKEEIKGPLELRQAFKTLSKLSDDHNYPFFLGNVEGREVFNAPVDVLVTGGFAGNVFLKTAEGMAQFLLKEGLSSSFKHSLDYKQYPGATLCGVNGIVIKCHGEAKVEALSQSLLSAIDLVKKDFIQKIQVEISCFFASSRGFL